MREDSFVQRYSSDPTGVFLDRSIDDGFLAAPGEYICWALYPRVLFIGKQSNSQGGHLPLFQIFVDP